MDAEAVCSPGDEQLDPEKVIEVETDVGPLWLERNSEILTPTLLAGERWEPEMLDFLPRLLRPGMTVVDAGANVGYISVHASKLVGPTGSVYCVEADPANVGVLRANLWRNGCTNAKVLPVAAWSERSELSLHVIPEGGACTHVSSGTGEGATIPAYRLDELIDQPVDYLKVDCERPDHVVLAGAAGLFRENPDLIATVEFVPDHPSHLGDTPTRDPRRVPAYGPEAVSRLGPRPSPSDDVSGACLVGLAGPARRLRLCSLAAPSDRAGPRLPRRRSQAGLRARPPVRRRPARSMFPRGFAQGSGAAIGCKRGELQAPGLISVTWTLVQR